MQARTQKKVSGRARLPGAALSAQEGGMPLFQGAILPSGGWHYTVGGRHFTYWGRHDDRRGRHATFGGRLFTLWGRYGTFGTFTFYLLRAALRLSWDAFGALDCVFGGAFGAHEGASEADGGARAQCAPPLGAPLPTCVNLIQNRTKKRRTGQTNKKRAPSQSIGTYYWMWLGKETRVPGWSNVTRGFPLPWGYPRGGRTRGGGAAMRAVSGLLRGAAGARGAGTDLVFPLCCRQSRLSAVRHRRRLRRSDGSGSDSSNSFIRQVSLNPPAAATVRCPSPLLPRALSRDI